VHFVHLANTLKKDGESAEINVLQGSVATNARRGGIFDIHLTANLPRNLPVKKILESVRTDRIMVMSPWPCFWPTLYV